MSALKEKQKATSPLQGGSRQLSPQSADAFEHFTAAIRIFSAAVPARTSIRQVMAFSIIAHANTLGRSITLSEVREIAGPALGQAIEKTISQFFEPTKRDPEALGWMEQEVDEDDRRKKYLKLTDKGRYVVNMITEALLEDRRRENR